MLIPERGISISTDHIVQVLIMRPDSLALSDAQERIIDADIIADDEIIAQFPIGILGIGPNADAVLSIAKHQVIAHHGCIGGMPEINAAARIIVRDIVENMSAIGRMVNAMHILAQFGIRRPDVVDHIANNVIVMGRILAIINARTPSGIATAGKIMHVIANGTDK